MTNRKNTRMQNAEPGSRRDHYQDVTDRVVAALEAGVRPWQKP